MPDTAVNSFVVRFVQQNPPSPVWHGLIRHVQSNEETHFTHLQEAIHFMGRYVVVEQDDEKGNGREQ